MSREDTPTPHLHWKEVEREEGVREERKGKGGGGKVRGRAYTKSVNSVRDKRNKLTHEKQESVYTPHSVG